MRKPSKLVVPALLAVVVGTVIVTSGCAAWRLGQTRELVDRSEPLQSTPADAAQRLLIVGDSTGVGTGASAPENSLAGLLAQAFPRLQIDNRAADGALIADVRGQLEAVSGRYDAVLVQAGGNDVIRLRSQDSMGRDMDRVTELARARSDHVLLMPAGNVGNAPFFFAPVSWLMSARARSLHSVVRETAQQRQAVYINLYKDKDQDPFAQQPQLLHASDGLHPSDPGYRIWFEELMQQAQLATLLAPSKAR